MTRANKFKAHPPVYIERAQDLRSEPSIQLSHSLKQNSAFFDLFLREKGRKFDVPVTRGGVTSLTGCYAREKGEKRGYPSSRVE